MMAHTCPECGQMNRKLDKTKKSNIKCEHCQQFNKDQALPDVFCPVAKRAVYYWNRCRNFQWHERYDD